MSAPTAALLAAVQALAQSGKPSLVGIDGRCGSGKTTLAARLAKQTGAAVVHTDDFYLPPARRAPDWQAHPAANMDFSRLRTEVLLPFLRGEAAIYRAYSCKKGAYLPARPLPQAPLLLLEGSYALHPALGVPFALRVFVTCPPAVQTLRLQAREGERFAAFRARWIPLEEAYFAALHPAEHCDFILDTSRLVL